MVGIDETQTLLVIAFISVRPFARYDADSYQCALATLAFLAGGHSHLEGSYLSGDIAVAVRSPTSEQLGAGGAKWEGELDTEVLVEAEV